ncbi:MAG: transposase [Anaerolineaceae bacterium]|nr:transposase [Anaerolineaceae bacterium]
MHTVISTWTELLQQFFPIFTAPGSDIFVRLITGWVLCTTRRTVTGMLPFADPLGLRAHDAYHRFLPDARWDMQCLWQALATLLIQRFCRKGLITLALDDTLFHRSGRKVDGAGYWRDAVRSTQKHIVYAWGLNLVVLTLQIQPPWGGEPLGLPINMRLHRKKELTLIELAEQMINEIAEWFPERRFRVVGDGFYATLAGTSLAKTTIISRIRRDANLYDLPPVRRKKQRGRPRTKGKKLAKPQTMANRVKNWKTVTFRQRGKTVTRQVYTRVVLWYAVSHTPVLLVICRDPEGKEKDDFFFTTDLSMTAQEVLECYNDRWAIEDTFKNTKQLLGGQEPQTFKGQGPERAAGLSLWLYSVVWLWYLNQKPANRYFIVQPWYAHKGTPSFADAIACLRRCLWRERIKYMFGNSAVHDKKFEFLLEALAPAA